MREIVLDTETTGLDPASGHRVVEIGCVELINHVATGAVFQRYINPERPMPAEAEAVHGLSDAFLSRHPAFAEVAPTFLSFLQDSPLVIHNAAFDMGFLNAELARLGRDRLPAERAIDTLQLARQKFPGAPANLDALCRRFEIDLSDRQLHGALKDATLLSKVYLELRGGREPVLTLVTACRSPSAARSVQRSPRLIEPSAEEQQAHAAMLERLIDPLWRKRSGEAGPIPQS
jgi:DNA polymerase-3 subunit epsilon